MVDEVVKGEHVGRRTSSASRSRLTEHLVCRDAASSASVSDDECQDRRRGDARFSAKVERSECGDAGAQGGKPVGVDAVAGTGAFDLALDQSGLPQDPQVL